MGYRRNKKGESDEDAAEQKQPVLTGFRVVHVFDVSQTEGKELLELNQTVSGEVGRHPDRLIDFLNQQNNTLEFSERMAPALGVSYGGKIVLLPGQSKGEEFVSLVHEMAHELIHKAEHRILTTQTVRETEAEAVAFVVSRALGLDNGHASTDDINRLSERRERLQKFLLTPWQV